MGGTPCFAGTRVPIQILLDDIEAGNPISEFLEDFCVCCLTSAQAVGKAPDTARVPHPGTDGMR